MTGNPGNAITALNRIYLKDYPLGAAKHRSPDRIDGARHRG